LRPLRCGIIGCGRIGCGFDDKSKGKTVFTHAGSYYINPKTRLVSLCDIDKSKLKKDEEGKKNQDAQVSAKIEKEKKVETKKS